MRNYNSKVKVKHKGLSDVQKIKRRIDGLSKIINQHALYGTKASHDIFYIAQVVNQNAKVIDALVKEVYQGRSVENGKAYVQ